MGPQRDQEDWMMGGSADPQAALVLGLSEAEVAQMAVEAYQYAASKSAGCQAGNKGVQFRGMVDLCGELENLIAERLGLDPPESEDAHTD